MRYFSLLLTIGLAGSCAAQYPGALDTTYRPGDLGFGRGDGTDRRVGSCVMRPDGRLLIGGGFDNFNGRYQSWMGSLNTDGTRDTSFVPTNLVGNVSPHTINAMVLQPDGMMLIGGNMNRCIQRIQVDGTVDSTFVTGPGFEQSSLREVYAVVLQPDGRILVGGRFTSYNGTPVTNLTRLNANGTLDVTFLTGSGLNGDVLDLVLQPDGKIVVVGRFTNCWGPAGHMVRLNANGTLDPTFQASPGADADVIDVALRNDGTLLLAGSFFTVNSTSVTGLCRLTSTGTVDPGFSVPPGLITNYSVRRITEQADQHILVSANNSALRLMPDGAADPTFASPVLTYQPTYTRAIDAFHQWPDGRIFITGSFASVNGHSANHIALLEADGSYDSSFNAPHGFNYQVDCMDRLADGSVVLNGLFNGFDGTPTNSWNTQFSASVVRLDPNGELDTAFTPYGETSLRSAQAIQSDGKILIGGFRLTRLNPDGSLDGSFPNGPLAGNLIQDIAMQPDGKILLSGNLQGFGGVSSPGIVRLNDDGTVDGSFVVGAGFPYPEGATRMALQPDGRIIVTGPLITYNDTAVGRLCRLMPNGAIDTSFHTGTGFNGETADVALLPDGRMLVSGYFESYNGYASEGLVLLMPNGDVDSSFVSEPDQSVTNGWPVLKYDPIGKILFGINYSEAGLLRLNLDGSIDPTFDTGTTLTGLTDLVVQPDSTYLICGSFTSYNGVGRNRIARIQGGRSEKTTVQVKAFLGGPYYGGTMGFTYWIQGLLPLTEPYTAIGYPHTGGGGGESIAELPLYPHLLTDWVVVELRDASDPTIVVASQSALLRRDAQVISTRLLKNLVFDVPHGSYYVAVHHRNHLGVMTASAIDLDDMPTHVDFTLPATPTYGTDAQKLVGSRTVLWSGDANNNGTLKYTGAANDRDAILVAIGGINPLNTVNGYLREDVNLDGTVKYTGALNDRDPILVNIGAIVTGIRLEQVP